MRLVHTRNNRRVLRGRYAANGYAPALVSDFPSQFYVLNGLEVGFSDIFNNSGGSLTASGWTMDSTAGNTLSIAAAKMPAYTTDFWFAMSGTATFGDNDQLNEIMYFDWRFNNDNHIYARLRTSVGTSGGRPDLIHRIAGGVLDASILDQDFYLPGTDVPFSIAGRVGSDAVQLAADGDLGTTDNLPGGLVDLSAADFDIGPTFTGTIHKLIIGTDPIGDAGIASASA